MSDYIDDVFGPTGALAGRFQGYAPRAGQVAMVRAVDAAMRERGHLLVEAGTGTGKSLAYLVPAIYYVTHPDARPLPPPPPPSAVENEREMDGVSCDRRYEEGEAPKTRAIIVTANIALQEQLVKKDLPLLREVLPWKFTYALLKGVSNYVCKERLYDEDHQTCDRADIEQFHQIREWALETDTGDKSELAFEPPPRLWSKFSVSADECIGKDCEHYKECFPRGVRKRAREADVVVTNYALFFLDLLVRHRTNGVAGILPPYNIAVLDEGHKAVDIARDFFGFRISEGSIDWVGALLPNDEKIELHRAANLFFKALREHKHERDYKSRIRKPFCVDATQLVTMLDGTIKIYNKEAIEIDDDKQRLEEAGIKMDPEEVKRLNKLIRKSTRAKEVVYAIAAAMRIYGVPKKPWVHYQQTPEATWYWSDPAQGGDNSVKSETDLKVMDDVFYIEEEGDKTYLCSIPISIAEPLNEHLFSLTESVTVTSATLVARGSFEYVRSDLGVENPRTLIAESPFAWGDQALLVLPTDVPEPNLPTFTGAVVEKCLETINLAKGRMLGLFTSYKNLNAAYERARMSKYRVLRQGDMPRTRLIEEFRRDVNSVLLGVESFWAGVDVQGESLSCVFIDRLPFTTPDDPLMDALSEKDKDWFKKYSIPQAIIAFKQGFGRLIRTTTDRGVVVLMDKRISTKWYGKMFIDALPPVSRSTQLEDVRRFLDGEMLVGAVPAPTPATYGGRSMLGGR